MLDTELQPHDGWRVPARRRPASELRCLTRKPCAAQCAEQRAGFSADRSQSMGASSQSHTTSHADSWPRANSRSRHRRMNKMPDPKTIKLLVTIPDPGEWCRRYADHSSYVECWLFSMSHPHYPYCRLRHNLEIDRSTGKPSSDGGAQVRRPQSCKDAEVKP